MQITFVSATYTYTVHERCDVNILRHTTIPKQDMMAARRNAGVGPIRDTSLLCLLYQRETETDCYLAERISCRLVHEVTLQVKRRLAATCTCTVPWTVDDR